MRDSNTSRHNLRRLRLVAVATSGLLLLMSAPAGAADDTQPPNVIENIVANLRDVTTPGTTSPKIQPKAAALPVVEDDDSPGHETPDPVPPDHASASGLVASLAGNDVAGVALADASMANDDSTTADSTALSLGGNEIIGAHADSDGDNQASAGDPLEPVCEGSDGALCAALVYADAEATEQAHSSSSSSETGVASACVGGDDPTAETCSGPVEAGVIQSSGSISRTRDGHTRAESMSQVANLCLARDPLGTCTVGADVLRSEGTSDSRGTSTKESQVLGLTVGGTQVVSVTEPTAITIPPNCPSPSLACVFLNQGERYLGQGVAGHAAQALDAAVLNGEILATVAQSETLVHKTPADPPDNPDGPVGPVGPVGDGGSDGGQADDGGVLPETGGPWRGLFILSLLSLGLGALLVAWSRRESLVHGAA